MKVSAPMSDGDDRRRDLFRRQIIALVEAGRGNVIESLVFTSPRLREDVDLLLECIREEYLARHQHGQSPQIEDYLRRFPQHAERLQELLAADNPLRAAGDSSIKSGVLEATFIASNAAAESSPPNYFGRYRIEQELGRGAMGVVYLAEDSQLQRKVALKVPSAASLLQPDTLERVYREARTAGTLRHANICPVYDVGAIDGRHYLTMAYIPGKSITSFLTKGRIPASRQVALLIRKIALALDYAHQRGIVHRDLKPSNVMLDDRGEPIVMDFGLACQLNTAEQARLTQSGVILGTPAFMSPEQIRGEVHLIGPASDIYSLGVMMYQLLTGKLPYEGPISLIFAKVLSEEPPRPSEVRPDVDPALELVCLKMMAKERSERYANMKVTAAELTEYLKAGTMASLGSAQAPTPAATRAWPNFDDLNPLIATIAHRKDSPRLWRKQETKSANDGSLTAGLWRYSWLLAVAGLGGVLLLNIVGMLMQDRPPISPTVITLPSPSGTSTLAAADSSPPVPVDAPKPAIAPFDAEQAKRYQEEWATYLNVPVEDTNSIGMTLALIPAGEFLMGSPDSENHARDGEKPQHRVRITKPFYLGQTEVTQGEYELVMGTNPSMFEKAGRSKDRIAGIDTSRFPVEWVSWYDTVEFCNKLSSADGLPAYYLLSDVQRKDGSIRHAFVRELNNRGYRLPTEAEWEYACRAGTISVFHFGDASNGHDANVPGNQPFGTTMKGPFLERTTTVGSYVPNAFGLFDMHGNVWECCWDVYDGDAYGKRSGMASDPIVNAGSDFRVFRGGSWNNFGPQNTRSAIRHWCTPDARNDDAGFRVLRSQ